MTEQSQYLKCADEMERAAAVAEEAGFAIIAFGNRSIAGVMRQAEAMRIERDALKARLDDSTEAAQTHMTNSMEWMRQRDEAGGRDREPWHKIGKHMIASAKAKDGWHVITKQGGGIGFIEWHEKWRQYLFVPAAMTAYTHDCLTALGQFLTEQNAKRKGSSR